MLTYHVQHSQRTKRAFGVFEQCAGPGGWFVEIAQFDSESAAQLDASERARKQIASLDERRVR